MNQNTKTNIQLVLFVIVIAALIGMGYGFENNKNVIAEISIISGIGAAFAGLCLCPKRNRGF